MRFTVRYGVWRSPFGDTWPHDESVETAAWPQATHLVSEPSCLLVCASGAGGGSQQAMFRSHLDPLLQRAHAHWQQGHAVSTTPKAQIDRFFTAIQHEFEVLKDPPWAHHFQASAVALLIGAEDCAIANVGVDRAWLLRDGRFERISEDYSLGTMVASHDSALSEHLRGQPGAYFGRFGGMTARWQIRQVRLRESDVFVLASGFCDTGVNEEQLEAAVKRISSEEDDDASIAHAMRRRTNRAAQRLGQHLADIAARNEDIDKQNKARWYLHSRLALAIVQIHRRGE